MYDKSTRFKEKDYKVNEKEAKILVENVTRKLANEINYNLRETSRYDKMMRNGVVDGIASLPISVLPFVGSALLFGITYFALSAVFYFIPGVMPWVTGITSGIINPSNIWIPLSIAGTIPAAPAFFAGVDTVLEGLGNIGKGVVSSFEVTGRDNMRIYDAKRMMLELDHILSMDTLEAGQYVYDNYSDVSKNSLEGRKLDEKQMNKARNKIYKLILKDKKRIDAYEKKQNHHKNKGSKFKSEYDKYLKAKEESKQNEVKDNNKDKVVENKKPNEKQNDKNASKMDVAIVKESFSAADKNKLVDNKNNVKKDNANAKPKKVQSIAEYMRDLDKNNTKEDIVKEDNGFER